MLCPQRSPSRSPVPGVSGRLRRSARAARARCQRKLKLARIRARYRPGRGRGSSPRPGLAGRHVHHLQPGAESGTSSHPDPALRTAAPEVAILGVVRSRLLTMPPCGSGRGTEFIPRRRSCRFHSPMTTGSSTARWPHDSPGSCASCSKMTAASFSDREPAESPTQEITVPDIGNFTDVPVIEVHVQPGDVVAAEDPLVTLESDKATMDVPARSRARSPNCASPQGTRCPRAR